jgi:hypothetical protein
MKFLQSLGDDPLAHDSAELAPRRRHLLPSMMIR